jgi:hypothetical protein
MGAFYNLGRRVTTDPSFPPYSPRRMSYAWRGLSDYGDVWRYPLPYRIKNIAGRILGVVIGGSIGFVFVGPFALLPLMPFEAQIRLEQVLALLLTAYVAAFVGNYHQREKTRKLLESVREPDEHLNDTARRLMCARGSGEELSQTVERLKEEEWQEFAAGAAK